MSFHTAATSKYIWKDAPIADANIVSALVESLNVDPVIAQLLAQRGVSNFEEAKTFFRPHLGMLHDPYLMKDMDKAVDRVMRAIDQGENIMIFGDYDVDGTTAVSLVFQFLSKITNRITTYIPDRYEEGYGISFKGIDFADDNDISLIIALDCGIKSIDKIDYAIERKIDFIICDHHLPGETIPNAVAVLDPKQGDCQYPYKELSGCGVGFKLCQALLPKLGLDESTLYPLLDILAVSIGADIVDMMGENRVLAFAGLQRLNSQPRLALKSILEGRNKSNYDINDVVFAIAPRINAAGRIEHGKLAVELLTSEDPGQIKNLVETINNHNEDRKGLDRGIFLEAEQMIIDAGEENRASTVVFDKSWHKGVVGIVASRLIEVFYRPTIVLTESHGKLAGSARSVHGFDLYSALEACSEHLIQFGGHMYAAGMTLEVDQFENFKAAFEKVVAERITDAQKLPLITIDADLKFDQIQGKFFRILHQFAPFGPGNLAPIFRSTNISVLVESKKVGTDDAHLKVYLRDLDTGITLDGIAFGWGSKLEELVQAKSCTIAYHLEANEFRGNVSLQLRVLDFRTE